MANFKIDESLCTGCGLCAAGCPELFEIGSDDKAHVKPGGSCDREADEITGDCPVGAITVA